MHYNFPAKCPDQGKDLLCCFNMVSVTPIVSKLSSCFFIFFFLLQLCPMFLQALVEIDLSLQAGFFLIQAHVFAENGEKAIKHSRKHMEHFLECKLPF